FVYLPPYSPDLNPIEQVWRLTRRDATHNIFFSDVHELEQAVDDYYSLFAVPNTWLKSLCSFNFAYD
ncbi:MAG: transposase, partial [Ruminococcus sp.]|nr:transposase [Ruminococcus sp.]